MKEASPAWKLQLLFIVTHVPLCLSIPKYSPWATRHAWLTLAACALIALVASRPGLVVAAASYIAGAEVFWRMKRAEIPWEAAKYAIALIALIYMVRRGQARRGVLPLVYLLLLLPSVALTFSAPRVEDMKGLLTFNLSGPLALALCSMSFSSLVVSAQDLRKILVAYLGPTVGIAAVGAGKVRELAPIDFSSNSNVAASGGFGPNQVSAVLGLAVVFVVLYLVLYRLPAPAAVAFGGMALFLIAQCALTFSRGGLYMAMGSLATAMFYLVRDARTRWKIVLGGSVLAAVLALVVLPRLERITGGTLGQRFRQTDPTGREVLAKADLRTWMENPVFGVGPGMSGTNRARAFYEAAAHTEYTRLVAEHGIFGLVAIALLVLIAVRNISRPMSVKARAVAVAAVVYGMLFMAVEGMRVAAPAFCFGLSCLTLAREKLRIRRVPVLQAVARARSLTPANWEISS